MPGGAVVSSCREQRGTPALFGAAVYAYALLVSETGTRLDRSTARALGGRHHNRGLTRGLSTPVEAEVVLEESTLPLPFGELVLATDQANFFWGGYQFKRFIPVGEFVVRGLSNRYRQAGIGAPLAAELEPVDSGQAAEAARKRIPQRTKVPLTAFLRIATQRRGIVAGMVEGKLELYAADQASTVAVGGRDVPLELEPTAALAYQLEGAPIWDFEIAGFRFADQSAIFGDGLVMMRP